MVSLSAVQASNRLIASTLPAGLVAVFVGGTSGIGEISVKTFAKYARRPRVYLVGRSQESAARILSECKALNPEGEFHLIPADVSLIRNVDALCEQIKARESSLNLLFISAGVARMDRFRMSCSPSIAVLCFHHSNVQKHPSISTCSRLSATMPASA